MFSECRAFVFPQEEDFGLTILETAASGRPVIAFAGGGALETVDSGITGIFFAEQTVDSLCEAIQKLENIKIDSNEIRRKALQFSTERFKVNFMEMINREWARFPRKRVHDKVLI
jgi:glycosyltransferase involved in cell wall biosynthesis